MIVIQAGHLNIQENCIWALREQPGEPGEAQATQSVAQRLAAALSARGQAVLVADANFNCLEAARRTYDAVVSLHCGLPGVGVGHPDQDSAAERSAQLRDALAHHYAQASSQAVNDNVPDAIDHYLFQALAPEVPFALVELGDVEYVQEHEDQVVQGLYLGLLDFLQIPEHEPTPQWEQNLQPHPAAIVLNRPVRQIDLSNGIAGGSAEGLLHIAYLTHVGDQDYYVPAETGQGQAEVPIGYLRSEVDSASGGKIGADELVPPPAPAGPAEAGPPPSAASPEPAPPTPSAAAGAPAGPPAGSWLQDLQAHIDERLSVLEREVRSSLQRLEEQHRTPPPPPAE